jgi:glucosamine--fructose-6-phosphate aminotransferase (isomerizing)
MVPQLNSMTGVGHTRWATHGGPSQHNAHPHCDCQGNIIVVHNGIILNFDSLKKQLTDEGHKFISETDTEVIPHLIEKYYNGNLEKAVEIALRDIKGTYALIALIEGESKLVTARKENPLIIGIGDRENFIASDAPAILDYTNRVIYLEDGDIGIITADSIRIKRNGSEVNLQEHKIFWNVEDAQKAGYEHFMLKEIHEQPKVIRDTIGEYSQTSENITEIDKMRETSIESMLILACGSSYHSGLIGKYIIEKLLEIPVRTELSSEFNYFDKTLAQTIAIVITQSGETADTIKTIKRLQEVGCRVLAITNVVGSSASRIANQTIYTRAGPEMSVAATKSFLAQLMTLYWLAMSYSKADVRELADMLMKIRQLPSKVQQVLDDENTIRKESKLLAKYHNVLFIGRGINFPVALEGALKLKEISYIHAEGFAAGELKHGPFALLSNNTPIIAIVVKDNTYDAMLTNIKEVKARGSPLIALAEEGDEYIHSIADSVIPIPQVGAIFSPVVNTVALQLLAYYTAREKGTPIDFPRNLAKSVTVE